MLGRTTFIIAHRIQSVMDAGLILVLEHGQIVQRGTHQELMAQDAMKGPDIYRRIYDMQARIEVELERELAHAETRAGGPDHPKTETRTV
jgi:ATP-binding cassette subfamily B protein